MRRTQTDQQVTHACRLAMLGKTWRALDDYAKSTWILLHACAPPADRHPTPYLTFVAANIAIYAATGTILRHAPPAPVCPQPIADATLCATFSSTVFSLTLALPASDCPILIYAAAPVPHAQNIFDKPHAFRLIGALPAGTSHTDLAALYQSRFRARGAGSKIALKLVAVSPSGHRTAEHCLSALTVTGAAQNAKTKAEGNAPGLRSTPQMPPLSY